ncbi:MAG: fructosamine kinase family protein [Anaerolineales bacterium]
MIPAPIKTWLIKNGHGPVTATHPIGGGCISNGARLHTQSGRTFFLKQMSSTRPNQHCPPDMFAREAEGLNALRGAGGPRFPEPYLDGPDFLLLEDLNPAPRARGYWATLGRQLAALHDQTHPQFGFPHDNYIGSTPQPNPFTGDGYVFFAGHRLNFQAELAGQRGLLSRDEVRRVSRLAASLPNLVPPQPASLLHGDLWSGNIITGERGQPALIDPAAHYGWAEADLAMAALFGSPPREFYSAYQEARPTPPGPRERFPIYNLYHLLNHLNLFGRGYYGQVMAVLRRFA